MATRNRTSHVVMRTCTSRSRAPNMFAPSRSCIACCHTQSRNRNDGGSIRRISSVKGPKPKKISHRTETPICNKKTFWCTTNDDEKAESNDSPYIEEQDIKCCICYDTQNYQVFETLECGHSFHMYCFDNWTKSKNNCPMCRAPM